MYSQYVLYLTEIYIPPIYRDKIQCDQRYVNQLGLESGKLMWGDRRMALSLVKITFVTNLLLSSCWSKKVFKLVS